MAELPNDPVFSKYKFYTENPKTKLNRKRLIRVNSIYDDGTDAEAQKKSKFTQALHTLVDNITLHCYNRLFEPNRPFLERIFWLIVHILNAWFFAYLITNLTFSINLRPLLTSLQDTIYPAKLVPFPAVAFCSNNRISREAAMELAQNLTLKDPQHRPASDFLDDIYLLSSLYDMEIADNFRLLEFQEFLEDTYLSNTTDLTNVIHRLTPSCADLAISCHWGDEERPCVKSPESNLSALFNFRRTTYGFCCTFNYNRVDNFTRSVNRTLYMSMVTGPEMSLIVTLNNTSKDTFFNYFFGPGIRVLIFDENEYPDIISGGVLETVVLPGTETFVRVEPITVQSQAQVLYYGIETRECIYPSERPNRYGGDYTRSSCILNCRIRSVVALCHCVPFYLYVNTFLPNNAAMPPVCTLQNVRCLQQYRLKWSVVITKIMEIEGLEKEMEEALYCPECLAACDRTSYSIQSTSLPLVRQNRNSTILPSHIEDTSEVSVVRVFFGSPETWLYNQDLAQYWYEIASLFGGLFGLTAGFSIVSGLEIVYFILWQLGLRMHRNIRQLLPKRFKREEEFIIYP